MSKLIWSSISKSCDLDPCPTQIVKDSADILAGSITVIINLSLAERKFPDTFKIAHVTPLLKKPSLYQNELSNFRPVSVLNFVSKLIEKIVASQIKSHMQIQVFRITFNQLNVEIPPKRLFCIFKMIFCQLKTVVNLLLFRFWIFLRLLTRSIMTSCSVDWLSSLALMVWCCSGFDPNWPVVLSLLKLMVYCLLSNCYCAVFRKALCWVHFFFTIYTTPLSSIITAIGLKHHLYADATQIYTSFVAEYIAQSLIVVQIVCWQSRFGWIKTCWNLILVRQSWWSLVI